MQTNNKQVSIIIVTYNQLPYVRNTIESLKVNNTISDDMEVLLVDNKSNDEFLLKYLDNLKSDEHFKVIFNNENSGLCKAHNLAASKAQGKYLLFLNPDVLTTSPTFIYDLLKIYDSDVSKKIGIVIPKLISQNALARPVFGQKLTKRKDGKYYFEDRSKSFSEIETVEACGGACVLIKRDIFDEIGGYDEDYGIGGWEDSDFAMRVKSKGYDIICSSKHELLHYGNKSYGNGYPQDLFDKNWDLFLSKWKPFIENNFKPIKRFALLLEGGVGDHISATPLLRNIKKAYPDSHLCVCAMFWETFLHNPDIDQLFSMDNPGIFYDFYVRGADYVNRANVYFFSPQHKGNKHVSELWCDLHNIPFDYSKPELFCSKEEDDKAIKFICSTSKPIILLQIYGACDPKVNNKFTANKDWPVERAQELVNMLNDKFDFVQVGVKQEPELQGVSSLLGKTNYRDVFALVKHCFSFVTIDSFIQHASAAFNKKGVVLWGRTNPKTFGYEHNINLFAQGSCPEMPCGRPEGILFDIDMHNRGPKGELMSWQCPDRKCMNAITVDMVRDSLLKIWEEKKLEWEESRAKLTNGGN